MTADTGIFTCRASNPAGVAECSAELYVEGKSGGASHSESFFLAFSEWNFTHMLQTCEHATVSD